MNRIEIPEKNITMNIPSEVEEMSPGQFTAFLDLVLQHTSGKITIDDFKIKLIIHLLGVRLGVRDRFLPEEERNEAMAEIYRLSSLCESFFEDIEVEGQKTKSFRLYFTRNFFPVILGRYHGPKDALQDVTFCEYRSAYSYYTSYGRSRDEHDLNRMIAVLYRPRKRFLWLRRRLASFDGQERIPFLSRSNPEMIEKRAAQIARLPMSVRYGIFLYFSGCSRFLSTGPIMIDGREIDLSIIYDKASGESDSPDLGLVGVLYNLAESKVFGSIEQTDNQNIYDIMIRLYQVIRQSKETEAKFNSISDGTS